MPKQEPFERVSNFDEVALGYTEELAREEAAPLPGLQEAGCVDGCPVDIDIPGFISCIVEGDFAARHPEDQGDERAAGRLRARLPAGGAVREELRPGQEGRARRHRAAGALRRRLGGASRARSRPDMAAAERQDASAIVGSGPAGHHRGRRPRPARPRGDDLRGAPRGRRRAHLRHPRVPPAQGDRPARGRLRREPGRRAAPRLRRRQDADRRRACSESSTPSSSAPGPGCRGSWTSPART